MGPRVGIGREVMMMVMRGMTRKDKRMMMLLLLNILTKLIAVVLLADVDRSLQTQTWYKETF